MKQKILNWIISTVAIFVVAYILQGVTVDSILAAFIAAVVLGLINMFIKPILLILTLPFNILTLGLFTLVINALLIMLTGFIVPGFDVDNFWWALLFGLLLSLVNTVLHKED